MRQTSLKLTIVLLFGATALAQTSRQRPLEVDDLFRLKIVHDVVLSPDGKLAAYVVQRPRGNTHRFNLSFLQGDDNADVWVVPTATGQPTEITSGEADGTGFWNPKWSPDGERLAMFSIKSETVRLVIWTKASRTLKVVSERAIELIPDCITWISSSKLVFAAATEGLGSRAITEWLSTAEVAPLEWKSAANGKRATVSVLESGAGLVAPIAASELVLLDVVSDEERALWRAPSFASARLSPSKRKLAFLAQVGVWRPDLSRSPENHLDNRIYKLMVTDLADEFQTRTLVGTEEVFAESLLWSSDSTEIAALGFPAQHPSNKAQFLRCRLSEGSCAAATREVTPELGPLNYINGTPPLLWVGGHNLLTFGKKTNDAEGISRDGLRWWAISEDAKVKELSRASSIQQLFVEANGSTLIALMKGRICRISGEGNLIDDLTGTFKSETTSIVWPQPDVSETFIKERLVFEQHSGSEDDELYQLDLSSQEIIRLKLPSPTAAIVAYHEADQLLLFEDTNRTGTYLWSGQTGKSSFRKVSEENAFLGELAEGEVKKIEYRSEDGEDLDGWVIFPVEYQKGKRYPLITWVYGGEVYGDEPPNELTQLNPGYPLVPFANLQLLAAHGYIVVLPSMPAKYHGEARDLYGELPNGVLPALDKLVNDGIADPQRIGVMGHSHGGYSTLGLIAQSDRFKVAVAISGNYDDFSFYGTFRASLRYSPVAHEDLFRMWQVEDQSAGKPPWQDLLWVVRNGPIFYADRIKTPLMIVHGDIDDAVPMQQAEEMFTTLYRQGKRSEFVRYWGEGHQIESPANVRDLWQRIYAWFDEYLKDQPARHSPSGQ